MRLFAIVAVAALLFAGCSKKSSNEATPSVAATTSAPTPTPCALEGGSEANESNAGPGESALVTDVRPNAEGCPRVVFEFKDQVAGYRIGYAQPPFTECGSGATVATASWDATAYLDVHLEPAAGVDLTTTGEATYTGPRDIAVRGDVLKHLKVTCDFEGVFEWIIGLDKKHEFKVLTLENPSRIVIEISQA